MKKNPLAKTIVHFSAPRPTPPISRDILRIKLTSTRLSSQDVRVLLRSDAWNELGSRNARLTFLDEFVRIECAHPLDTGRLAGVLDLTRDRVRKGLTRPKKKKTGTASRRPPRLTLEQEQILWAFIRNGCNAENYVTPRAFLDFVEETFHMALTDGWMTSFLSRYAEEVKCVTGSPQELPRV
jgi:hypothetical protein